MQKNRFIAYSLHGSSTKVAGTAGAAVAAARERGYIPDLIAGVSAGALLSVPFALAMYEECLCNTCNVNPDDFFAKKPFDKSGNASWSAVFFAFADMLKTVIYKALRLGKASCSYSLGVQDCKRFLRKIVNEELFDLYKNGNYAECLLVYTDYCAGTHHVVNAKSLQYDEYLELSDASAQLLITSKGNTSKQDTILLDGGYWRQNAFEALKDWDVDEKITDLVSIYVTPDNNLLPRQEKPKNIAEAALGSIELMQRFNYRKDEIQEREWCKQAGINLHEIRLPLVLQSKYDTNKIRLQYLQELARAEALKLPNIMQKQ